MIKQLYHGSSTIIEKPLFGYGKPYNDYGLGFYCTDSLEMAKEWGVGKQFVLKSKTAFDRIRFVGSEPAESSEWYAKKMQRDKTARREYFDVERNRRRRGDLYIAQIMDEEMKFDDPRLR